MESLEVLVENAKNIISAIIQKPKMSEKLLSKPPFRFLHDTITAITNATGFANGLYNESELDSAAITEKTQKIEYLEKIFTMVGICQGAPVDIRAGKVIGGLEPEYTCQFLILLAQLATNPNVDSDAAVRRCLAGESAGPPAAMKSSSRAESKSDYGHENSSRQELSKSRPDDDFKGIEAKRDDFDMVAPERGKSRGGTRGGNKPGQQTASTAGLNTAPGRPSTLDADIEKCDGSYEVTTELMGNLIAKPRMSEKLLSKPPFRFLHDIVVEVIKTTGFARTLFDESELNSENVKEKEQKIAFLEKIIALVGVQLNTLLEAKAGKIVAGLNPQDTNRFLQLLALAARDMPDSTAAVRTVLGQNSDTSAMTSNPAPAPVEPPSRNTATRESRERDNLAESRPKQEEKMDKPKESSRPAKTMSAPAQPIAEFKDDAPHSGRDDGRDDRPMEDDSGMNGGDASADGEKKSMRPTTARRRPPKIKDTAREVTAKETAPSSKKAEGILIDGDNDVDEDDDIAPEQKRLADAKLDGGGDSDRNQQSKLVQDILSRQAEQEAATRGDAKVEIQNESKQEKDGSGGIRLGKLRKTGSEKKGGSATSTTVGSGADIPRLRKAVQTLVQHTGPLGTCMDYIQEDVGTMAIELHRWEDECRKYEIECENQKRKTQEKLNPLRREHEDLEEQIKEQLLKVSFIKANIVKNESKIQQILRLAATS